MGAEVAMAKKPKVYAVRNGRETGIFDTWAECQAAVKGYPGAVFKGFATRQEAQAYLEESALHTNAVDETAGEQERQLPLPTIPSSEDTLTAYVDGSFHPAGGVYAFGCVFILPDGREYTYYGNGTDPESLAMRNVAGEMLGAMYAVQFARKNHFRCVDICYDYAGIEQWPTGGWKCNKERTAQYAAYMRRQAQAIMIRYHKVAAHTNIKYNELADQAAKRGLEAGNGIPPVELVNEA